MPNARPIAAMLFGVAAITDLLDGWVARRFEQMSKFRRVPGPGSRQIDGGDRPGHAGAGRIPTGSSILSP